MDRVGGMIWELVEGSHSLEEITAAIAARYDAAPEQIQSDVERLTAELLQENLVKVSSAATPRDENHLRVSQPKQSYESPKLNAYRDMAVLLALDPPMPGLLDSVWKEPDDRLS
jgi:hypothetical protein